MLSRRLEITADCSRRPERSDHFEPRVAWHGRGMGEWHRAVALSRRGGYLLCRRSGYAFAAGPRVEKGQYFSFAGKLPCRSTARARGAGGQQRLTAVRSCGAAAHRAGISNSNRSSDLAGAAPAALTFSIFPLLSK